MTLESTIREGRRAAELLMLTTVRVDGPGGEPVWDEDLGDYVSTPATRYEGKARIHKRTIAARHVDLAGQFVALQDLILSLPFEGTGGVTNLDTVTVTANALDPALVGIEFTIQGADGQTAATARRFNIERITA